MRGEERSGESTGCVPGPGPRTHLYYMCIAYPTQHTQHNTTQNTTTHAAQHTTHSLGALEVHCSPLDTNGAREGQTLAVSRTLSRRAEGWREGGKKGETRTDGGTDAELVV
jgi:hypothetical protein